MNMYPTQGYFQSVGDIVSVRKGLFAHVGVVVPSGVLQNRPGGHESVVSWEEFGAGQPVHVQQMNLDPWVVMRRVQNILASPRAYDAIAQNCEHTVHEVTRGKKESPQLGVLVWGALAALLLFSALSR